MLKIITLSVLFASVVLKKHALTVLLTLELIRLMIIVLMMANGVEVFFTMIMVCVRACEGAVGLSALIRSTRSIAIALYDKCLVFEVFCDVRNNFHIYKDIFKKKFL